MRPIRPTVLLTAHLSSLALLCAGVPGHAASPQNVLLIAWDGVQRDHLFDCYNRKLANCPRGLPNLRALSGGKIWNSTVTNGATDTKAGWTQFLTGYNASVTKVFSNDMYRPIQAGHTLFERFQLHFGKDKLVTLFIAGKKKHVGASCHGRGEPWCITKRKVTYFQNGMGNARRVGPKALKLLDEHGKRHLLAFFHFRDPDYIGHLAGESSRAYTKKIVDCDRWLGKIVQKLKALKVYRRTLIYVMSEHGFDEGKSNHQNAPYGFFATNDPKVVRSGDRRDLTPTLLARFGVPPDRSLPPLNGSSLLTVPKRCVPSQGGYIDYPGAPKCCPSLKRISLAKRFGRVCMQPTGGRNDKSGHCTKCGDGRCVAPENFCNCPADCKK